MSLCVQECVIHVSKNVILNVVHWRQSYLDFNYIRTFSIKADYKVGKHYCCHINQTCC